MADSNAARKPMRNRRLLASGLLAAGWLAVASAVPSLAGTWTPDPSLGNVEQHQRLYDIGRHFGDVNFDPDANLVGVHSKKPPNKKLHDTRESAYYAYGLLLTGDPADRARGNAILAKVVTLQDTKPNSPTFGSFNGNAEDPPSDQNSAAFVGLTLADVVDLDRRHPCLDAGVRNQVENATRMAVEAVMHRDVDAGYTNIALLSIALAAGGDKLFAMPGAGAWAQNKLDGVLALAGDGEFEEYLSPTYTGVALQGAYMAQKFSFSDTFAASVNKVIDHLWKQVALAYHAPTYQLGGPYLRAYGDNMLQYVAALKYFLYLGLDGNYPLPDNEFDHDWDKGGVVTIADLPIGARPEFQTPPPAWRQWNAVGSGSTPVRQLSQYRDGNFILGTVAFQDEWKQKRNLVAFWRNDSLAPNDLSKPDQIRIGFCIDETNETVPGFPGEKLNLYSDQNKAAALVAIVARTDVPGQGFGTLVFDDGAKLTQGDADSPTHIADGTMTAWLYPVSNAPVQYISQPDPAHHLLRVARSWNTADVVNSMHVLAYVIVFRPSDQPAPAVTDIGLKPTRDGASATATVDGTSLSVSFKN
jgi:hypothetical protein